MRACIAKIVNKEPTTISRILNKDPPLSISVDSSTAGLHPKDLKKGK